MSQLQFTKKMLLAWGGSAVYAQAEILARKRQVRQVVHEGETVRGVVAREGASEIRTGFRLTAAGHIESHCPCFTNQHQGLVCQHVVALAVELMLRQADPQRARNAAVAQARAERMAAYNAGAYVQRGARGKVARLQMILDGAWQAQFWRDAIGLTWAVDLGRGWQAPSTLARDTLLCLTPAAENWLQVLEDICAGPPPDRCEVCAADLLNLLVIAFEVEVRAPVNGVDAPASGAAGAAAPLIESHPTEAWRVATQKVAHHLQVDIDHEKGDLWVYPRVTESGGDEAPPVRDYSQAKAWLTDAVFLVSGKRGCVVWRGTVYPLIKVLPLPLQHIYQQAQVIERERVVTFLGQEVTALEGFIEVRMEVPPELFVLRPARPVLHLALEGDGERLAAVPRAVYDDEIFALAQPDARGAFSRPDPEDILVYQTRHLEFEKQAFEQLKELGWRQQDAQWRIQGRRAVLNFLGGGYPALVRQGWKVQLAPRLLALLENLPSIVPVAKVQEHSPHFLEVGFSLDLPGYGEIKSSLVQKAFNFGDSFIELGGRTILVDTHVVGAMRSITRDCNSRASNKPGHFLLATHYAPYLQASLNALDGVDVECTAQWRERAALANRSGLHRFVPQPLGALDAVLRPYQKEGVYWLSFLEANGFNGLLADEMGLGKTLQTLTWLNLPRGAATLRDKPALVVCPTSLVENWQREAARFVPQLRTLVISGANRAELFKQIERHDLVITSYALLRRDLEHYRAWQFSVAVLDEAQHIKNRSTQNAQAAKQLKAQHRLVLTGTPVENSVADLWSIMDFLMPEYLGDYESFRENYEIPIGGMGRVGELTQAKLNRKIHPFMLRRVKREVAKDLPERLTKVSYCRLSPDQQRVYQEVLNQARQKISGLVQSKGFERSRFEILALLMRLRQICCHLDLLKDHHEPGTYEEPSHKLAAFFELLDEALDGNHRMLVFSQFVGMLTILRRELEARQMPYCYLDGSTKDRLQQCQRFNLTPEIPVFLISLKAGGTGLNLTGADMVVHFDPWWNPAVENQATDRAHRIGQKRTVYSIKMITEHTIEEKVLQMQQRKQAVIDATVGTSDAGIMQQLSLDDIRELIEI